VRGASLALAAPGINCCSPPRSTNGRCARRCWRAYPRRWGGVQDALVAAALEDAADAHALIAPVLEEPHAFERFERLAAREARPDLMRLLDGAATRALPRCWMTSSSPWGTAPAGATSSSAACGVAACRGASCTISDRTRDRLNGKTTTVRLLATAPRAEDTRPVSDHGVSIRGEAQVASIARWWSYR